MSNVTLFAVGSVVFIFLTWATVMFLYLQFNRIYRQDQAKAPGAEIIEEGNIELLTSRDSTTA